MQLDSQDTIRNSTRLDSLTVHNSDTVKQALGIPIDTTREVTILGMPEGFARIIIPVLVTITIFFLGQLISWLKSKRERRREVDAVKTLVLTWIDLMKEPVTALIASCWTFGNSVQMSDDITPSRFQLTRLLVGKIDSLSTEKMMRAFCLNTSGEKRYEMMFNITKHFDFLKNAEQIIENEAKEYRKDFDDLVKEWNDLIAVYDNFISKENKRIGQDESHPDYGLHKQVLEIQKEWQQSVPQGMRATANYTSEKLLIPLNKILRKRPQNEEGDYAFNLSKVIKDLRLCFMHWQIGKNVYAKMFHKHANDIEDAYGKLYFASSYFKQETKTVNIFKIQ